MREREKGYMCEGDSIEYDVVVVAMYKLLNRIFFRKKGTRQ